ncbi:hypothetical protein ABT214_26930 [Micromonospora purpureochromogenes]|uniref:hypothetical protein n=1 Tax=Micromonospora purpureochromogenes TaxID=47872 RepID=UPI00332062D9
MSRFERVRGRLRRAYESGRESVRSGRSAPADVPEEARVASPASPGPAAPPRANDTDRLLTSR